MNRKIHLFDTEFIFLFLESIASEAGMSINHSLTQGCRLLKSGMGIGYYEGSYCFKLEEQEHGRNCIP